MGNKFSVRLSSQTVTKNLLFIKFTRFIYIVKNKNKGTVYTELFARQENENLTNLTGVREIWPAVCPVNPEMDLL